MTPITSVLFVGYFDILGRLIPTVRAGGADLQLAFGPRQREAWEGAAAQNTMTREAVDGAVVAETFDVIADRLDLDPSWLIVSVGSPFIFRQRHIDRVGGNIINSHGAPLPEHAGGGGMSWRILAGDRRGAVLLHRVVPGIDEGAVIFREDFEFPAELRAPAEWDAYQGPKTADAIVRVVGEIVASGRVPLGEQQHGDPTYFPRLATDIHGAIDWAWSRDEIVSFIEAFGAPHPGAFTALRGHEVRVPRARTVDWSAMNPHPFMSGLVLAQRDEEWIVAARGGYLALIVETDDPPRVGDRLTTPVAALERARSTRVEFLPGGMRERS